MHRHRHGYRNCYRSGYRRLGSLALFVVAIVGAAVLLLPPSASALRNELRCRKAIAGSTLRYADAVLDSRINCQNRIVDNDLSASFDCITGADDALDIQLERRLEKASRRLNNRIQRACSGVELSILGFPGICADPTGEPFSKTDLGRCVEDALDVLSVTLLGTYYPVLPHFYRSDEEECLRRVSRGGLDMFRAALRARQKCLFEQENQQLLSGVECRAEVPPFGLGTGNPSTDRRLRGAYEEVKHIAAACALPDLEALGFAENCPDTDGAPFNSVDVRNCTFNLNRAELPPYLELAFPIVDAR